MCSYVQPHKIHEIDLNNQIQILSNKYNYLRCYFYPKRLVVFTFKQDVTRLQFGKLKLPWLPSSPTKSSLKRVRWHQFPYKEELQVGHPLCVMITRITHTGRWVGLHVNWSDYIWKKQLLYPNNWRMMVRVKYNRTTTDRCQEFYWKQNTNHSKLYKYKMRL